MRTARRANRRVSMRGGASFAPLPGHHVSFYKRKEGIASYTTMDETNSTISEGIYAEQTPGGLYHIDTNDGQRHLSDHIGDIPDLELIDQTRRVRFEPANRGGSPTVKELTISNVEPYSVGWARGLKEHVYTGKDAAGETHIFNASDIKLDQ